MNNIDTKLLRIFLVLMDEKSVSNASLRLGMSQPALSQILIKLRDLFKDPLLLRTRQGMIPTDRAIEVQTSVKKMLGDYDQLIAPKTKYDPRTSDQRFVITCPEYAEHLLLPQLLARLRIEAPQVRIEIQQPQPERINDLLERGEVDFRIAWVLSPAQTLRSIALFQDHFVCLVSRNHPTIQDTISAEQLLAFPHVRTLGTGRSTSNSVIEKTFEQFGGKVKHNFLVQNLLTIPLIVAQTDMLALLPSLLSTGFTKQYPIKLLPPAIKLTPLKYHLYWHERSQKSDSHQWLRNIILEIAKNIRASVMP